MKLQRACVSLFLLLMVSACRDRQPSPVAVGSHAGLACVSCHTSNPSEEVVPPVAEEACVECHAAPSTPAQVVVANVTLSHLTHPGPGDELLGCAACHTHDTGEAPLEVRTGSCFLCHAEPPAPGGQRVAASMTADSCAECHVQPTHTGFARTGAPIDHANVLERGVSCLLCHYDVVSGAGAVQVSTCRSCHGSAGGPLPDRPDTTMEAGAAHSVHLDGDGRDMTCARCHQPLDHAVIKLASALTLECTTCHAQGDAALQEPVDSAVHRAEQLFYAGLDPHQGEVAPTRKFLERVSCTSCHSEQSMRAPPQSERRIRATNDACVSCHGPRFDELLRPWLRGAAAHTSAVGAYVQAVSADARIRGVAAAESLANDAVGRWALVDSTHAVHNLPGADALLRSALDVAVRSYRHARVEPPPLPRMGPAASTVSCVRCHYGVETDAAWIPEGEFDHTRHVLDAAMECNACHSSEELFEADGRTFDDDHGATRIGRLDCARCHHVESAGDCVGCHTQAEVDALALQAELTVHIPRGEVTRTHTAPFSHARHEDVTCVTCHDTPTAERPGGECSECHAEHHQEVASPAACGSCHGVELRRLHARTDHFECAACHTPSTLRLLETADRQFCMQCHTDKEDHRPEAECAPCHLVRTPEQTMRVILGAEGRTPARGVPR
jgi:hypothetical protein